MANREHGSCLTLSCSCPSGLGAGGMAVVQHLCCPADRLLQEVALVLQTLSATTC